MSEVTINVAKIAAAIKATRDNMAKFSQNSNLATHALDNATWNIANTLSAADKSFDFVAFARACGMSEGRKGEGGIKLDLQRPN